MVNSHELISFLNLNVIWQISHTPGSGPQHVFPDKKNKAKQSNPSSVNPYRILRLVSDENRCSGNQISSVGCQRVRANQQRGLGPGLGRDVRNEGGGPDRVAFREQPAQPAPAPASSSNTPWSASSCTQRKGHKGRLQTEMTRLKIVKRSDSLTRESVCNPSV